MLLVLGAVAGDRLVAELRELDPDLAGCDLVHAVAHDRPVAATRAEGGCCGGGRVAHGQRLFHAVGQVAQVAQQLLLCRVRGLCTPGHLVGDRLGQQQAGGDLRVERLGRRDAHLHVTAVGGVEHPVGLVGQVAAAPVDDRDDRRPTRPHQVDGAVRVGRRSRLADRDDERVRHVGAQLEAGELRGEHRFDPDLGLGEEVGEVVRQALPGDRSGALADDQDTVDARLGQPGTDRVGQRVGAQHDAHLRRLVLDELAAQRLAERRGRRRDLLQQEVRVLAPVDVAGRDLGGLHVVGAEGQLGAVVGPARHALEGSGSLGAQFDDLTAAAGRVLGIGGGLAVHPDVRRGLLDDAVGLRRDDVGVLGDPDVDRLATAAQCEQQALRRRDGRRCDRHRALERGHGVAERGRGVVTCRQASCHERRDHLRVGGDLGCDLELLGGGDVGVVVHIAVEHRRDEGPLRAVELLGALRVGVRLRDDPDRRPTRVPQHQALDPVRRERRLQQVVVAECVAQRGGVVAELADLGRGLVDHDEHVVDEADRARPEAAVPAAGELGGDDGILRIEPVADQLDLEARRVTAPHLEPVERGQRLVHAEHHRQPGGAHLVLDQRAHLLGGPEAISADGPGGVLAADQCGVGRLEVGGRRGPGTVEQRLDRCAAGVDRRDADTDASSRGRVGDQGLQPRDATQRGVDRLERRRSPDQSVAQVLERRFQVLLGDRELLGERRCGLGLTIRWPANDRDDPAHVPSLSCHALACHALARHALACHALACHVTVRSLPRGRDDRKG